MDLVQVVSYFWFFGLTVWEISSFNILIEQFKKVTEKGKLIKLFFNTSYWRQFRQA